MKKEIKLIIETAVMALILNGCSGGDTSSSGTENTGTYAVSGILTDSPVDGAKYTCGNVTNFTAKNGSFFCENTPIEFYVGNVKLGEIHQLPQDAYVTPQDLANVQRDVFNDNVSKIAVFLQSLDNDGEMEESIILDRNLIKKLENEHSELQQMTHTALIELLDTIGALNVVDKDAALAHLHQHMGELLEHAPITEEGELAATPEVDPETPISSPPSEEETNNDDEIKVPDTIEETPTTNTTTSDTQETITPEETEVPTPVTPTLDDALKQAYLDIINEARLEGRECGEYGYFKATSALTWNEKLYDAAYEHSKDMAISNTFSHTGSGTKNDETAKVLHSSSGSSVGERIEHNGYTNWRRYGENIAAGTSMDEAVEAMEGWLDSPGHCKNIMKPEFQEAGMAVYYNENSHYKYYWTQDFGMR